MTDKSNALAELAERFTKGTITVRDIDAAGRIISELSKLFTKGPAGKVCIDIRASWCPTLAKCLAIAEEGDSK